MKLGAAEPWRCRVRWEQPRQRRSGSALPDGPGPASETERCTNAGTSGGTPSSGTPARTWWIRAGQQCVLDVDGDGGQLRVGLGLAGSEATVKICGVVVARLQGKSWAPIPSNGHVVNVGTVIESPSLPVSLIGSGKAHRPLTARWWGGALVVVRGRESRSHGQGEQQVRSNRVGTSGARR
jgi:hypothetical protein